MGKIDWRHVFQALKDTDYKGVVLARIRGCPRCLARGVADVPGVYRGNADATAEFENEYKIALTYLTGLANEVNLRVE